MAKVGRPTKITPDVLRKIEEVAALDGSVAEMAYYADCHVDTVYAYLAENKEFSDRITSLRSRPILKARQTIIKSLENPQYALEYLKRKRKAEFGDAIDHTSDGKKLESVTKIFINKPDGNTNKTNGKTVRGVGSTGKS